MDKKSFLDCTGGILIVLCVIGLIGAFVFAGYLYSTSKVQDVNVQIVMNMDSTGVLSEESKQQVVEMKEEWGNRLNQFFRTYEKSKGNWNYTDDFFEKIVQPEYKMLIMWYYSLCAVSGIKG